MYIVKRVLLSSRSVRHIGVDVSKNQDQQRLEHAKESIHKIKRTHGSSLVARKEKSQTSKANHVANSNPAKLQYCTGNRAAKPAASKTSEGRDGTIFSLRLLVLTSQQIPMITQPAPTIPPIPAPPASPPTPTPRHPHIQHKRIVDVVVIVNIYVVVEHVVEQIVRV